MPVDLSLVSLDELWSEIARRSDGAVMVFQLSPRPREWDTLVRCSGAPATVVGLLDYGREEVLRRMLGDRTIEYDDDDDECDGEEPDAHGYQEDP